MKVASLKQENKFGNAKRTYISSREAASAKYLSIICSIGWSQLCFPSLPLCLGSVSKVFLPSHLGCSSQGQVNFSFCYNCMSLCLLFLKSLLNIVGLLWHFPTSLVPFSLPPLLFFPTPNTTTLYPLPFTFMSHAFLVLPINFSFSLRSLLVFWVGLFTANQCTHTSNLNLIAWTESGVFCFSEPG